MKQIQIKEWDKLLEFDDINDSILHESQMLMFNFLSEIEKYQAIQGINKKKLAQSIKTSASYVTQLFRGNKPLNFETIAKIQHALNINFHITATPINFAMEINEDAFIDLKSSYKTNNGTWLYKNFLNKSKSVYDESLDDYMLSGKELEKAII